MIDDHQSGTAVDLINVDSSHCLPPRHSSHRFSPSPMPRISFSVVLTALLLIALTFLLRSTSPQPSYYRDVFGHGHSLSVWLHREEERYAKILEEREQLVLKWGPTNATVDP